MIFGLRTFENPRSTRPQSFAICLTKKSSKNCHYIYKHPDLPLNKSIYLHLNESLAVLFSNQEHIWQFLEQRVHLALGTAVDFYQFSLNLKLRGIPDRILNYILMNCTIGRKLLGIKMSLTTFPFWQTSKVLSVLPSPWKPDYPHRPTQFVNWLLRQIFHHETIHEEQHECSILIFRQNRVLVIYFEAWIIFHFQIRFRGKQMDQQLYRPKIHGMHSCHL